LSLVKEERKKYKQGLFLGKLKDQRLSRGNMKSSHESNVHGFLVAWVALYRLLYNIMHHVRHDVLGAVKALTTIFLPTLRTMNPTPTTYTRN